VKRVLHYFSIFIILAGIFFLIYWDAREWGLTACVKISCFIKQIAGLF